MSCDARPARRNAIRWPLKQLRHHPRPAQTRTIGPGTWSLTLLALALGLYLIVAGALALGRGVASADRRAASLAKGAVLATAGTLIVAWPDLSRATLTILAGVVLCLVGALDIGEAFIERRRRVPTSP